MYESNLAQMYVFLVVFTIFAFYLDFLSKNCKKKYFSTMYIHCIRITVVHIHVNVFFFFKNSPSVSQCQTQTELNRQVTKRTDKHAVLALKRGIVGCKIIRVRCTTCSYNTIATSIGLLDKITIFVCTGKFSYE